MRMLPGLGFVPGMLGLLPPLRAELWLSERTGPEGTEEPARREGFLWVCEEGSTFLSLEVTDSPREISSKTAPISAAEREFERPLGGMGGGGGGGLSNLGRGGGGGGAPVDDCGGGDLEDDTWSGLLTSSIACKGSTPLEFHVRPEE